MRGLNGGGEVMGSAENFEKQTRVSEIKCQW